MEHISDLNSAKIRQNAGIKSNWEFRQFMQNHGKEIMKIDAREYYSASGNNPFYSSISPNKQLHNQTSPFLFQNSFDTRSSPLDNNDSDLKHDYLKKNRIAARMVAPTFTIQNEKRIN